MVKTLCERPPRGRRAARALARALAGLLLWLLPACTTGVLIVDPDRGYQPDGERYLRLRLATVRLEVVEAPPAQQVLPGALCLPPGAVEPGCTRALQFRLPFLAWNGSDASWPITLGMFRLVRLPAADPQGAAPPAAALTAPDPDATVALVPPRSGARFDVLVHVGGLGPGDEPLRGRYELTVMGATGEPLLVEHLSVGQFDQLGQALRFVGSATLLLVAAAAL